MSPFPKALVFDLDGTLVDTAPDLAAVLNWLLVREGRATVPEASVRHMVGQGARSLIIKGMSATGSTPNEAEIQRLFDDYITHYASRLADLSQPFPRVRETLEHFLSDGMAMAVCTNKPEALARQLLEALDMSHYFKALFGGDTLPVKKPDPLHLLKTIEALGMEANQAVMVGDSISDIAAARNAGVPVIGVSFGYTETPIAELKPDKVIHHFADLPQALAQMWPGI